MLHLLNWDDVYNVWWALLPSIVFVLAALGLILWAVVKGVRTSHATTAKSDDEEVLLWRFASGEIDAAECRERIDALHHHHHRRVVRLSQHR